MSETAGDPVAEPAPLASPSGVITISFPDGRPAIQWNGLTLLEVIATLDIVGEGLRAKVLNGG